MDQKSFKTLLARQGIYDQKGHIYAYELLYRNGDNHGVPVDTLDKFSGDSATSSVLAQLFTNFDINSIVGNKWAFINFTYNHFIQNVPHLLPKNRVVVEVLETVTIDDLLISNLMSLSEKGYTIALDDFIFNEETRPLIEIADIIKIDVLHLNKEQISTQLMPLKDFKGKLLAEKIEDRRQFNSCIELGFDFFQGFFLNKPDLVKGQPMTENKAQLIMLLNELSNENIFIERVAEIILQTPKLSYKILRLANSASLFMGSKIDSLRDAITLLGLTQIRNWVSLLMLASMDEIAPDLIERTVIRAKMCEFISKEIKYPNPHQAYTVGILSTLEGILNEPMTALLSKIRLCDVINDALIHHKGELGWILTLAIDYETGDFDRLEQSKISSDVLMRYYLQGIEYASNMRGIM